MKIWNALQHCLFTDDAYGRKIKNILKVVFFLYFLVLLKVIVFKYPMDQLALITQSWTREVILEGLDTANFTLFKTIKMYICYWGRLNSFENLFGNVLSFVPYGFILPFLHRESRHWWVLLINSFLLVCAIEIFQLITAFGAFDVDDILLNCAGCMLGFFLFDFCRRSGKRKTEKSGF
ncbi:MAG: VanZ family protein [Eubacteriales bacterium]|nr:VanZ family protein [Eubacteriales bacterium]